MMQFAKNANHIVIIKYYRSPLMDTIAPHYWFKGPHPSSTDFSFRKCFWPSSQ